MTVARGVDPRRYALLPFGGAGPLHATAIADGARDRRGSSARARAACCRRSGSRPRRRDATRPARSRRRRSGALLERARARARRRAGRASASATRCATAGSPSSWRSTRPRTPRRTSCASASRPRTSASTATATPTREVELVTVTASVWGAAPALAPRAGARRGAGAHERSRSGTAARELEAALIVGEPAPGERIDGPAICALPGRDAAVDAGLARRTSLADGTIELGRVDERARAHSTRSSCASCSARCTPPARRWARC